MRMGGSASGTEDALADGVLIADRLDGRPLDGDHGAPARLVSPNQYGFVSTKMQPSVSEPFWRGGCRPSAGGVRRPWRVKSSRTSCHQTATADARLLAAARSILELTRVGDRGRAGDVQLGKLSGPLWGKDFRRR